MVTAVVLAPCSKDDIEPRFVLGMTAADSVVDHVCVPIHVHESSNVIVFAPAVRARLLSHGPLVYGQHPICASAKAGAFARRQLPLQGPA